MIALKNLTVGYHGEALLSQVNLEFPQGQVTVLLGPNGCGKSTLLKTVLGLLPPLGGEILYDGEPISSLSGGAVARKAAYMAQNHTVPSIVAQRMVLHGRFPYLSFPRKYRKEDHEAVRRALEAWTCPTGPCRSSVEASGKRSIWRWPWPRRRGPFSWTSPPPGWTSAISWR